MVVETLGGISYCMSNGCGPSGRFMGWGDCPPSPPREPEKYFLNVSENKFSDKKFSLIPFVLSAFYVE